MDKSILQRNQSQFRSIDFVNICRESTILFLLFSLVFTLPQANAEPNGSALLPPLAWSAQADLTTGNELVSFRQSLNANGIIVVEWGDGSVDAYDYTTSPNPSETVQYTHQYSTNAPGAYTIRVRTCPEHVKRILFIKQSLTSLDVDALPNLEFIDASENKIAGTIDLLASTNLKMCKITKNYAGFSGYTSLPYQTTLLIHDCEVIEIWHGSFHGTLNLANAENLRTLKVYGNSLEGVVFMPSSARSNHPLKEFVASTNQMSGTLDLCCFPNLETVQVNHNQLAEIILNDLVDLRILRAYNNFLTEDIDLIASLNLIVCNLSQTKPNPVPTSNFPRLFISNARSLNIDVAPFGDVLDLSQADDLTELKANSNFFTGLILPNNKTNLEYVNALYNKWSFVDASDFTSLRYLGLTQNQNHSHLDTLDVTNLPALLELYAANSKLTGSIDLSQSQLLQRCILSANRTLIPNNSVSITMSNNMADLEYLDLRGGDFTGTLNLGSSHLLTFLDIGINDFTSVVLPTAHAGSILGSDITYDLESNNLVNADIEQILSNLASVVSQNTYTGAPEIDIVNNPSGDPSAILTTANFTTSMTTSAQTLQTAGWTVNPN